MENTNTNVDVPANPVSTSTENKVEDDVLFFQFLHNNPGAWELYNMVLTDNKSRSRSCKAIDPTGEQTPNSRTPTGFYQSNDTLVLSARKTFANLTGSQPKVDSSFRKSLFKSISPESAPADIPAMPITPVESAQELNRTESKRGVLSRKLTISRSDDEGKRRSFSLRSGDKKKKKGERIGEDMGPPPPNFIPPPPPLETLMDSDKKSHMDSYSLFVNLVNLNTGIEMSTKNWHMKTYRQVFVANKVVDWIMENLQVNRPKATQLGYELQTSGFIEGAIKGNIFKDDRSLFQLTEKGKSILKEQDFLYFSKAFDPVNGIEIKDRSGHFKKLKNCFTGEEFVTWFVDNNLTPNRERACRIGREFLENHLIEHVLKEQQFKDATLFYHLTKEGLLLLNQNNSSNSATRSRSSSARRNLIELTMKSKLEEASRDDTIISMSAENTPRLSNEHRREKSLEPRHKKRNSKRERKSNFISKGELSEPPISAPSEPNTTKPLPQITSGPTLEQGAPLIPEPDTKKNGDQPLFVSEPVQTQTDQLTKLEAKNSTQAESVEPPNLKQKLSKFKLPSFSKSSISILADAPELLVTPRKPEPPVDRRLPQKYLKSRLPINPVVSRVTEKRLSKKQPSQDNLTVEKNPFPNDVKENNPSIIPTTEPLTKNSEPQGSPKKPLAFLRTPFAPSNQLNQPQTRQTKRPNSSPPRTENTVPNPLSTCSFDSQLYSIIVRRFNKRGGVRIVVPMTLEELLVIANKRLNVSGGRIREIDTEAEISDIRLIKPDQTV